MMNGMEALRTKSDHPMIMLFYILLIVVWPLCLSVTTTSDGKSLDSLLDSIFSSFVSKNTNLLSTVPQDELENYVLKNLRRSIMSRIAMNTETALDCSRSWPSLDLFLPVHIHKVKFWGDRNTEFLEFFMRTFLLFWPAVSQTSVLVLFDEESRNSSEFEKVSTHIKTLEQKYNAPIKVAFNHHTPNYKTGYDRQQWLKFNADNFSEAEYVGFVDTDTVFLTHVDREDLFEGGKPVVNGRIGYVGYVEETKSRHNPPFHWPQSTWKFTGYEEPIR